MPYIHIEDNDFKVTVLHNGTKARYYKSWFAELSLYELIKEYDAIRGRFAWLNNYVIRGYELWNDSMINEENNPAIECEVDDFEDILTAFKQVHGITIKERLDEDYYTKTDKLEEFWYNYHNPSKNPWINTPF